MVWDLETNGITPNLTNQNEWYLKNNFLKKFTQIEENGKYLHSNSLDLIKILAIYSMVIYFHIN